MRKAGWSKRWGCHSRRRRVFESRWDGRGSGLCNPRLRKWAGARPPRALQTLKAKVFSLYASRQTRHTSCSLGLCPSVSRVLPEHRLHSASASYQRSQTSRNLPCQARMRLLWEFRADIPSAPQRTTQLRQSMCSGSLLHSQGLFKCSCNCGPQTTAAPDKPHTRGNPGNHAFGMSGMGLRNLHLDKRPGGAHGCSRNLIY